jgi:hypothetical protein
MGTEGLLGEMDVAGVPKSLRLVAGRLRISACYFGLGNQLSATLFCKLCSVALSFCFAFRTQRFLRLLTDVGHAAAPEDNERSDASKGQHKQHDERPQVA